MEFSNPIVGTEDLIRSAIKSPNFNTNAETGTVTGWRIAQDGTATFYNLVIGNTNFNIDEDGNAVFQNVSASDITLNGMSLNDTLYALPTGTIAGIALTGNSATYTSPNKVYFGTIAVPNPDPHRLYRLKMSNIHFDRGSTVSAAQKSITVSVYVGLTNPVAVSATPTFVTVETIDDGTSTLDQYLTVDWPLTFGTTSTVYFSFYFNTDGTSTCRVQNSTGDQSTLYVEDLGLPDSFTTLDISSGSAPSTGTFVNTYTATSSASFTSSGTNRSQSAMFQGYYDGTNGNQFSMAVFPAATIVTDLTGATVTKVELYLDNNHYYNNSGGTAVIGTHNQSSVSGNHSSGQLNNDLIRWHYDLGQAKWVVIDDATHVTGIGNLFKAGTAKGICLGQGPTTDHLYYGYFAGASQTNPPQLRITYTK